jgi:hypothetical protein
MMKKRITLTVEVNLDGVRGWGDNAEDFRFYVQSLLDYSIPHYKPVVSYTGKVVEVPA